MRVIGIGSNLNWVIAAVTGRRFLFSITGNIFTGRRVMQTDFLYYFITHTRGQDRGELHDNLRTVTTGKT